MSGRALDETSTPSDRRFGQAIALFAVCFLLLVTLGIAAQMIAVVGGLAFTLLVLVLLPAVIFVRLKGVGVRDGLRLAPVGPVLVLASLLAGAGGWSAAFALYKLVASAIGTPPDMGLSTESASAYALMLVIGALLPGICEECLFRGAIQGVLERRGSWFAVLLGALLFGLFHLDPWRILPAALLGCIFGWLVVRTGSLMPAIVAHAANNATALTVGRFLGEPPAWLLGALALALVAALGIVAVRTTAPIAPASHPLAEVPAGLPRAVAWAGGCVLAVGAAILAAAGLLLASLVTTAAVTDDALAPHIESGDTLVLIKAGSFAFDPSPGDTVALLRDGKVVARVVARVEDGRVVVRDGESELPVEERDLIGALVQILPAPDRQDEE